MSTRLDIVARAVAAPGNNSAGAAHFIVRESTAAGRLY